jgi:hypothetical protein
MALSASGYARGFQIGPRDPNEHLQSVIALADSVRLSKYVTGNAVRNHVWEERLIRCAIAELKRNLIVDDPVDEAYSQILSCGCMTEYAIDFCQNGILLPR